MYDSTKDSARFWPCPRRYAHSVEVLGVPRNRVHLSLSSSHLNDLVHRLLFLCQEDSSADDHEELVEERVRGPDRLNEPTIGATDEGRRNPVDRFPLNEPTHEGVPAAGHELTCKLVPRSRRLGSGVRRCLALLGKSRAVRSSRLGEIWIIFYRLGEDRSLNRRCHEPIISSLQGLQVSIELVAVELVR